MSKQQRASYIRIWIFFLIALIPRVIQLGAFVTPDERRWLDRSVDLFKALFTGNLSLAYHEGNPAGIITKWLGMIGIVIRYVFHKLGWPAHLDPQLAASQDIWSFMEAVQQQPQNILDILPMARLPIAVVTAAMIALMYLWIRRLWGERVALVGTFLIALGPFLLGHSRVLHQDALVTCFITLSILGLSVALQGHISWTLVGASGLFAGLAALTKPSGFFLAVWAAGWVVFGLSGKTPATQKPGKALAVLMLWMVMFGATYFVFWPATWSEPVNALTGMLARSTELASGGHDQFFMGQPTNDPGILFYPVVLFFRTSPLIWIGLLALVWRAISGRAPDEMNSSNNTKARKFWVALFIMLFLVFVSFSAKKSDRYLLPVFPFLDMLAAIGLVEILNRLRSWDRRRAQAGKPIRVSKLVIGLVLIAALQAGLALYHAPYYLSYYNPLAGGPWMAPHVLLIGWGEGLDQAGRYLDQKDNADSLAVASFYRREFSPYFRGEVHKVADSKPDDFDLIAWHVADYVVNYVSQVQREQPDEATVRYFRSLAPEKIIRLSGIDYAWIYETPEYIPDELLPAENIVRQTFGPSILFLGYDTPSIEHPSQPFVRLSLYWQCLSEMNEDYEINLGIVDDSGNLYGEKRTQPYYNQYRTSMWPRGLVLRDIHEIPIQEDTPPGEYHISLSLIEVRAQLIAPPTEAGEQLLAPQGQFLIGPIRIGEL